MDIRPQLIRERANDQTSDDHVDWVLLVKREVILVPA